MNLYTSFWEFSSHTVSKNLSQTLACVILILFAAPTEALAFSMEFVPKEEGPEETTGAPMLSDGEKRKLKNKTHKCPSCDKMFKEAREMTQHNERVHLGITHVCVTCAKVFTTLNGLRFHQTQARLSGKTCGEANKSNFCKICYKSHKQPVKRHEKGVKHLKHAKAAQKTASDLEKAIEKQRNLEKDNVNKLESLKGTALRVAMMEDDISYGSSEAEGEAEDPWGADGNSSD